MKGMRLVRLTAMPPNDFSPCTHARKRLQKYEEKSNPQNFSLRDPENTGKMEGLEDGNKKVVVAKNETTND